LKFLFEILKLTFFFSFSSLSFITDRPTFIGARRFLEAQFRRYMTRVVREHPDQAMLGGRPGLIYVIRAYMNVQMRTRGVSNHAGCVGCRREFS
jgi:hypothetical protein